MLLAVAMGRLRLVAIVHFFKKLCDFHVAPVATPQALCGMH
jgi:hypothetical protein